MKDTDAEEEDKRGCGPEQWTQELRYLSNLDAPSSLDIDALTN